MDDTFADVGNRIDTQSLERHREAVKRTEKPIRPMRKLFGENLLDRGMLRMAVRSFARVKGMEYEEAHRYLSHMAERMPFQEITPDHMLTFGERRSRDRLRKQEAETRLQKEHFGAESEDDGAGFRDPDLSEQQLARSMRGAV